jgi:hypothetical protein
MADVQCTSPTNMDALGNISWSVFGLLPPPFINSIIDGTGQFGESIVLFGDFSGSANGVSGTLNEIIFPFPGINKFCDISNLNVDASQAITLQFGQLTLNFGAILSGDDQINGSNGNDVLFGYGGNDVITGGAGNDVIDGGAGYNTAVYSGASAQYSITASGSTFTVADTIPGRDGTDTLTNIEHLQFSDRSIDLPVLSMATFPFTGDAMSQIEAIYIGYFGRAGDPGGTNYWTNQLLNGGSTVQTMTGIAASYSVQPESQAQYPFLANPSGATTSGAGNQLDQFINSVYQNLFDRAADGTDTSGGLSYWRGQILNVLATHDSTALANELGSFILQVAYGAQNSGAGQDQTVLANKVSVADALTQTFSAHNIQFGNDGSAADQFAHTDIASVTASAASVTAAEVAIIGIIPSLI